MEADHLLVSRRTALARFSKPMQIVDSVLLTIWQILLPESAIIALIREGAQVSNLEGNAIRDAIWAGVREIKIVIVGRDTMETEIAPWCLGAEYRDI